MKQFHYFSKKNKEPSTPSGPYSLRMNHIQYPSHRLTLYEGEAHYSGIKLYNNLPGHLKNMNSITTFKKSLKCHLIDKAYYSVGEFLDE